MRSAAMLFAVLLSAASASQDQGGLPVVAQWSVHEVALLSAREYAYPLEDVSVSVTFAAPSGAQTRVEAFWDGERTWRARFSPDLTGEWTWRAEASDGGNAGFEASGRFVCTPQVAPDSPWLRHGPLRVSASRTYLEHEDGTPFFWLGDTAWNGVLRSTEEDWERYLSARKALGFSVVQFVSTQWRGGEACLGGPPPFEYRDGHLTVNDGYFRRMDERVRSIAEHGMVAAPIILWALTATDPGQALPEATAIRLGRYIVARWGALPVVWLVGGDGHYYGEHAERWRRIGRGILGEDRAGRSRLASLHPCGLSWVGEDHRDEPWYDFIGYQSGHGSAAGDLRWLTTGPPATNWQNEPLAPVINLEPNYEGHPSYHASLRFGAHEVRRAAYWSLLGSPTAGVTYGTNPIWVWPTTTEDAENHGGLRQIQPWHTALDLPGARAMGVLRGFMAEMPWWELRPAPDLLATQPGTERAEAFVAVARNMEGSLVVAYSPAGEAIVFVREAVALSATARWFDPAAGTWLHAEAEGGRFEPPGGVEMLLVLAAESD